MSDELPPTAAEEGSGRGPRLAALVILGAAAAAFVVQNTESANVDWLVFDFSLPLWALIVVSAVVGVVLRDLVTWLRHRRD